MIRRLAGSACALLVLASCGRRAPVAVPRRAAHGSRAGHAVALTFDACSSARTNRFDARVVDALDAAGAPATFFLGGRWMEANPQAVRRLAANPRYELGLHGWTHRHYPALPEGEACAELDRCQDALERLAGRPATLFRPPYGAAGAREARIAGGLGLSTIEFDLESGDPDPAFSAARLTRWVLSRARAGSIIVFHVNGHGVHTAEALPGILAGLKSRGLTPVRVGELLRVPGPLSLPRPQQPVFGLFDRPEVVEHDPRPAHGRIAAD